MNLFKNSIESIDQCLRAPKDGYQGRVRVGATILGSDQLQMYVEDNGQGAEPESLKRAFEFGYSTKSVVLVLVCTIARTLSVFTRVSLS